MGEKKKDKTLERRPKPREKQAPRPLPFYFGNEWLDLMGSCGFSC